MGGRCGRVANSFQLKFALCINVCDAHWSKQVNGLQCCSLVKVKLTDENFPQTRCIAFTTKKKEMFARNTLLRKTCVPHIAPPQQFFVAVGPRGSVLITVHTGLARDNRFNICCHCQLT